MTAECPHFSNPCRVSLLGCITLQFPHADPEIPEPPYRLGERPVSGGEALSVSCERKLLQECLISVPLFCAGCEPLRSLAFALQEGAFARAKDNFDQETRLSPIK